MEIHTQPVYNFGRIIQAHGYFSWTREHEDTTLYWGVKKVAELSTPFRGNVFLSQIDTGADPSYYHEKLIELGELIEKELEGITVELFLYSEVQA